MPNLADTMTQFRRYASLLEDGLGRGAPFSPHAETATAVQAERGIVFAHSLLLPPRDGQAEVERLLQISTIEKVGELVVVDRAGHHRPVYRPLLIYSWLQAFRLQYETLPRAEFGRWEEALRVWADLLEA